MISRPGNGGAPRLNPPLKINKIKDSACLPIGCTARLVPSPPLPSPYPPSARIWLLQLASRVAAAYTLTKDIDIPPCVVRG